VTNYYSEELLLSLVLNPSDYFGSCIPKGVLGLIHYNPDICSKCPQEYPRIAYLGFIIVLSTTEKLPSEY